MAFPEFDILFMSPCDFWFPFWKLRNYSFSSLGCFGLDDSLHLFGCLNHFDSFKTDGYYWGV